MTTAPKPAMQPTAPDELQVVIAFDCQRLLDADGPLPLEGVLHRNFSDLGPELLSDLKPTRIILPLFSAEHDAMAVIEILEGLKFSGQITVIGPDLPRPRLVERELRAMGPGVRLSLISP
ncbi:MAG: hypothetical protein ABIV25_09010 [Paracoccaceae bacterium]